MPLVDFDHIVRSVVQSFPLIYTITIYYDIPSSRWFLKDVHCDPAEAVQIHLNLKSKQSLAIHWGTFPLSDEDAVEPALELARSRKAANVTVDEFFTMAHGETLFFGEKPRHDFAVLQPSLLDEYVTYFEATPTSVASTKADSQLISA